MVRSWFLAVGQAVLAVLVAGALFAAGQPIAAVIALVVFLALATIYSPLIFPRSLTAAEAQSRSAADGRPIVFWRPGCQFCLRLRLKLGRDAGRAHWVNIWTDPDAAAAVRAVADGNETVPTLIAGTESIVNPPAEKVRALLGTP